MRKFLYLSAVCVCMALCFVGCSEEDDEPGEKGDTAYPANSYCAGQALFDVNNPTKLIGRLDKPFLQPTDDFEKSGQYPAGTVFVEGLVYYRNKWYLYYGCADSFVAVAVSDKQLNF